MVYLYKILKELGFNSNDINVAYPIVEEYYYNGLADIKITFDRIGNFIQIYFKNKEIDTYYIHEESTKDECYLFILRNLRKIKIKNLKK